RIVQSIRDRVSIPITSQDFVRVRSRLFAGKPSPAAVRRSGRRVRRSDLEGISHSRLRPPERILRDLRKTTILCPRKRRAFALNRWPTSRVRNGLAAADSAVLRRAENRFVLRREGLQAATGRSVRGQIDQIVLPR